MTHPTAAIDSVRKRKLQTAVLKWYGRHRRQLPWRDSADAYRIWLSEIMLQQTTVAAVIPYFDRFTEMFPDVNALAAASIDDVLRLWEGLGYYSRARNLHKAAQVIVEQYKGKFPADVDLLQQLPGIGRYTAGAICSFAFDQAAPILEANTERLYARLMALTDEVQSTSGRRALWDFAAAIVPQKRPGDFNQALMDIGSAICRPQDPDCQRCPLVGCCRAFESGRQQELPRRKPRVAITSVDEICVVIRRRNKFLLRRRTADERWAGLWDFVRMEIDPAELRQPGIASVPAPAKNRRSLHQRDCVTAVGTALPISVQERVFDQVGVRFGDVIAATEFTYSVTRYRVRLLSFLCENSAARAAKAKDAQWFSESELAAIPLSRTGRQVAEWLVSRKNRDM